MLYESYVNIISLSSSSIVAVIMYYYVGSSPATVTGSAGLLTPSRLSLWLDCEKWTVGLVNISSSAKKRPETGLNSPTDRHKTSCFNVLLLPFIRVWEVQCNVKLCVPLLLSEDQFIRMHNIGFVKQT